MFELTGKTALITGATGAIGGSIARVLHRQGATVAISGTRRDVLDRLAAEIGDRVHVLPCNLADAAETDALVPRAEAGDGSARRACRQCRSDARIICSSSCATRTGTRSLTINLSATFRLARAAVRGMMRRRFGRVIAITSVVGATGNPGQANYVAAKAGITGMIKSIAQEYAKRGVTANCVAPGFIVTPMTDKLTDKQREAILARIPANRPGTAEEVAAAVAFLASNEAGYVTGQTLHVNGGMAMI